MWLSYVNSGIRADFWSIQHNRRQPLESKTIKRASQPNMTVPFKFLPHEILNKPKPALVIRIYHASPSATKPETEEFESQREPPMSILESRRREPPTPTHHRHLSHHVASCFTGSIIAIWCVSSDLHHQAPPTANADEPIPPLSRWLQRRFVTAPPLLFSFSFLCL